MVKKFIALTVLCTLLAIGISLYSSKASMQTQTIPEDQLGTLHGFAMDAQSRGEYEIDLAKTIIFEDAVSLDAAIANYTVLAATPIAKQSYVLDNYSIGTWYKFRVNETLAQKPLMLCSGCPSPIPDTVPPDMLPLNAGEILVLQPGGSQLVDGVTINISVADFPDFTLNQKYLLFLNLDASRSIGSLQVGPAGAYMVDNYGGLSPIFQLESGDNPVWDGLTAQYGSNLNQLRNTLNPPPPPPTCDQVEEQSCYDRGGTWIFNGCYCREPNPDPCTQQPWREPAMDCGPAY